MRHFDNSDWDAFAGAEAEKETGEEPLISETDNPTESVIIVSGGDSPSVQIIVNTNFVFDHEYPWVTANVVADWLERKLAEVKNLHDLKKLLTKMGFNQIL